MDYHQRLQELTQRHRRLIEQPNQVDDSWYNGVFQRWRNPVITAGHIPLTWRYDLDERSNPFLMERLAVNAAFNAGAICLEDRICLVVRVEGADRKSFFAVAESSSGVDGFRFRERPVVMPETSQPDTNVYDMRLTRHADGWIYGLFCTERKDPQAPQGDTSSAIAQCGIARTRDLDSWERLEDLVSLSPQQRNVVLHPEFVDGKYAFYTRPQDSFISAGRGGGIGWGLCEDITAARIGEESIVDPKVYHTIKESKNGAGAVPIKTEAGWLHIAHGVRNTAAGLRYVLYCLLCDLKDPSVVTHRPSGYFLAPIGAERVGDVSNVAFCNGAAEKDGTLYVYYASSDTRLHVATTSVEKMVDYCVNTPEDPLTSAGCVAQRIGLIEKNLQLIAEAGQGPLSDAKL